MAAEARVTARQVAALPDLDKPVVLGGDRGLDKVVQNVLLVATPRSVPTPPPGAVLVLDGSQLSADTYFIDFVLRAADQADAAMVIVAAPASKVGLASRRLANKVSIPLLAVDRVDSLVICDRLRQVVHSPAIVVSTLLLDTAERLRRLPDDQGITGALKALDMAFDAQSTLLGSEGGVVAGAQLDPPVAARDRLPVPTTASAGQIRRVIQPISMASRERPSFWLIMSREAPTPMWMRAATGILQITASYFAVRLISERLELERDARFRLGVLNAVIASTERPEAALIHQIGVLGWQFDGWCTAVHLNAGGGADQLRILGLTAELATMLSEAGLRGPLIERPDGWTTWTVSAKEPAAASYRAVTNAARDVLRRFCAGHSGLKAYAGIGRPYTGLLGLRRSLAEAREASTIAQAGGGHTATHHIDELGIERILFGWYASPQFADFATTLLDPLLGADRDGELLHTLETYLDNESSPALTADILGVHRNTVLNRINRIRDLLTADLEHPDQRLAVQLACRVAKLRTR
jgi:purine catabolism regulator